MNSKSTRGIQLIRVVYFLETGGAIAGNAAALDELLGSDWAEKPAFWHHRRSRIDWNRLLGLATMVSVSVAGWTGFGLLICRLLK